MAVAATSSLLSTPAGKAVAVIGGGKTGAAVARLLAKHGARVTVYDDADAAKVKEGLKKNGVTTDGGGDDGIAIAGGGLDEDRIADADFVVLSPGVPRAHAKLQKALARVPFVNELEVGFAFLTKGSSA